MKGFLALAIGGLIVVALSAIPPEHGRFIAIALLILIVLTPAVGRYASAGRSSGEAMAATREREH